jgi:hypothetical protein
MPTFLANLRAPATASGGMRRNPLFILGFLAVFVYAANELAGYVLNAGTFLTASRGAIMWAVINGPATLAAFIWGAPWREGEALRAFRVLPRALIGVALGIVLLFIRFPGELFSRVAIYQETLDPISTATELGSRTWDYPVKNFIGAFNYPHWVTGYGIGTTALGGQYVARFFHVVPPVAGVESGFATRIVEMGILGLLLWLVMAFAILRTAWRVVKKLPGTPFFPVGFIIFSYLLVLFLPSTFAGIQPYEDFLLNAYFWLLLGILFRLPAIKLNAFAPATTTNLSLARYGFC